ncbi:MAG: ABC transporter ATP-binding protein [Deltaproteobacteria bacterium]|nr:MAG: ABC transporter ATP-binding protein [Deltaproteobacteria bacterium]
MITVSGVSKGFGGRMLFEDVNVSFSPGHNYGLTGPNGCGKSTFMKLLIGAEASDAGSVSLPERTAWLRQDHTHFDEHKVLDTVIMGNHRLWQAMVRKEHLYDKDDAEGLSDAEAEELGELEMVVAEEDGYTAEADAAQLLDGLGVEEALHDRPMAELQGGIKLRVLLAQALFGRPDALLLDEPTNHLDLDSIRWLEGFLIDYKGVLVVISHDRRFLNAVCDQIADIDYETIITYPGNYDDMVRQKAAMRGRLSKDQAAREKKIAQLQDFISRFGAGTRASQTRSRARQIEKLKPEEIKRSNIRRPFIRFPVDDPSGRDVLDVADLSFSYPEPGTIFHSFHAHVQRGDKVAILGANGIGKTTLLRVLMGELACEEGEVKWGHNAKIGWYKQEHRDEVQAGSTVFEWLFAHRPEVGQEQVRAVLGRMLFSGEDGGKPTGTLSGGEAARLMMSQMILMGYNVLILDEPTNHLDLESISALGEAIESYEGTIFYVTHDRDLASHATRIWAFDKPGHLIDYAGTIDEYLDWLDRTRKQSA